MSGTLILFSSEIELTAVFPDGPPDGLRAGCTGVGPLDAAIGTHELIARHAPEVVIFIGTCGAHAGSGLVVGDVAVARDVMLSSGDVARGQMRLPSLVASRIRCDEDLAATAMAAGNGAVRGADVSCTLGITESEELARLFWESDGAACENMEAFAVARVAGAIPCAILLGVTNLVGPEGGRGWRENYRRMMRAAFSAALALLAPEERELIATIAEAG